MSNETPSNAKAAIYCRVSTEEQAEAKTIENQIDFAKRYCSLHEIPIHDVYRDDGITGTVALGDRPEGARLLNYAKAGRFGSLLVYRLDRFARNTLHLLNAFEALDALGVGLRSMTEQFDSSTPTGKCVMTILASFAALERDTIVERTVLGRVRAVTDGRWVGGLPPYGYRVTEGKLEIDPQQAEIIHAIYDMYTEQRMGTVQIATYLNANNVPTLYEVHKQRNRPVGRWNQGTICRLLKRTVYKGVFEYGKCGTGRIDRMTYDAPAIISGDQWNKTQSLLKSNFAESKRNCRREYLLRSLIRCDTCGHMFVGSHNNSTHTSYYQCSSTRFSRQHRQTDCNTFKVRADDLEGAVWEDIRGYLERPEVVMQQLEARMREEIERQSDTEADEAQTGHMITAKQSERERVISLYRKGMISDAEAEKELAQLQREVDALVSHRESLFAIAEQSAALKARLINTGIQLEQMRKTLDAVDFDTRRECITTLVDSITVQTVTEDGHSTSRITIRYTFDKVGICSALVNTRGKDWLLMKRK